MKIVAVIGVLALLAGCATGPKDSAQTVYTLKAAFAGALGVADAYAALPPCPGPTLCSDIAMVGRMYQAANLVSGDLDVAQAAATQGQSPTVVAQELATAQIDLDALTALTSQVKTK